MEDTKNRDKKEDLLCIWNEFPYLGDPRELDSLNIFKEYAIYKTEIELMAQMRIILMSQYKYKMIKPYIEEIKNQDNVLYDFIIRTTEHYLKNIYPNSQKHKMDDFNESISFVMKENQMANNESKVYTVAERM